MTKTIIVVDNNDVLPDLEQITKVSFEDYLAHYPKRSEGKTRIINLCDTQHYLSKGYYCSLLAEARQHNVLPSVSTINDLRDTFNDEASRIGLSLDKDLLALLDENPVELRVFFGWVAQEPWQKFAKKIFDKHPSPILSVSLSKDKDGIHLQVDRYDFSALNATEQADFLSQLDHFTQVVWHNKAAKKRHRWEMAILVDENEPHPPSDKKAIELFIKAASKVGIHAETISSAQSSQISQYDALFIRETTAIDHPTYRLSRKAEREGLVVIDDPTSILRCCNKVFLHDAFSYNNVPSLKTQVVIGNSDADLVAIEAEFSYPLVLKMPEGSFSKGVFKVNNREELSAKLGELLKSTALVLAQEFLYTEFDWRIGVLNGRAIYACRYMMAHKHWQIYNHDKKRNSSGDFETLATFEAPQAVLKAALNACKIIGNGLYGVDIKQHNQQVYVLEVNDNPSIDQGVEDKYLGKELYMHIMSEFVERLEKRGR